MPRYSPQNNLASGDLQVASKFVNATLGCINSIAFRQTIEQARKFAQHDRVTILINGEPGTGKTMIAKYLHDHSPRRHRVFHRIDLGTLDDALSSSELFGHVSGAFSGAVGRRHGHFASADRGTLFLDEIGKASMAIQRRLLHTIEYGEFTSVGADRPMRVDVRVIAATNVSLTTMVDKQEFLPDLYARLGYFQLHIPPLRERRSDIPTLVRDAVNERCRWFGYDANVPPGIHASLMSAFCEAPWPGNVRELLSAIDYLLVAADGAPELRLAHCEGALSPMATTTTDRERAQEALRQTGSVSAAARKLGLARTTVYRHLSEATLTD